MKSGQVIPLLGFAPDADPTTPGVIPDCTMMIPSDRGMICAPRPTAAYSQGSEAQTNVPTVTNVPHSAQFYNIAGTTHIVAGYANKLWKFGGSGWQDWSRTASAYATAINSFDFAQFGVHAVAAPGAGYASGERLQTSNLLSAPFADIASAPKAYTIASASRFVVAFNTQDGASTIAYEPDRWYCSARDDHTSWTLSPSTLCATGILPGASRGIRAGRPLGDDLVAYKEDEIWLGQFVGPPEVWAWKRMPYSVGTPSFRSVAVVGPMHYFLGRDNLYAFDGANLYGLMDGKLRKWFRENFASYHVALINPPEVRYDASRNSLWIKFPKSGGTGTDLWRAHVLVYHLGTRQFGKAEGDKYNLLVEAPASRNLFYADMTVGGFNKDDNLVYPLNGGDQSGNYVAGNGNFNGSAPYPSLTTWDIGAAENEVEVTRSRLQCVTAGAMTATAMRRANLYDALTTATPIAVAADGKFDHRQSAKWHRIKYDFTAHAEVIGVGVEFSGAGKR